LRWLVVLRIDTDEQHLNALGVCAQRFRQLREPGEGRGTDIRAMGVTEELHQHLAAVIGAAQSQAGVCGEFKVLALRDAFQRGFAERWWLTAAGGERDGHGQRTERA
jgi:hypothetical protein